MVSYLGLQGCRRSFPHPRGGASQRHLAASFRRRTEHDDQAGEYAGRPGFLLALALNDTWRRRSMRRRPSFRAARLTWSRQPAGLPDRPRTNRPRRSRTPCSPCFIWSRSGIANSYNDNPAPARGADDCRGIIFLWQFDGSHYHKSGRSVDQIAVPTLVLVGADDTPPIT